MIYCSLCVLEFNHESIYELHLGSKSHSNALKFQEAAKIGNHRTEFYCSLCSLYTDTNAVLDIHLQSEKHQVKCILKQKYEKTEKTISKVIKTGENFLLLRSSQTWSDFKQNVQELNCDPVPSSISKQNEPKPDDIYWNSEWCHLCFCKYTSNPHKESHLKGKEHKKKIQIKSLIESINDEIFCAYCCQRPISAEVLKTHLASDKHLDQVKRYEQYYQENKDNKYVTKLDSSKSFYSESSSDLSDSTFQFGSLKSTNQSSLKTSQSSFEIGASSNKNNSKLEVLASDLFNDSFSKYLSRNSVPDSVSSLEDEVFKESKSNHVQIQNGFHCILIEASVKGVKYFKLIDENSLPLNEFDDEAQFQKVLDAFESCMEIKIQTEQH